MKEYYYDNQNFYKTVQSYLKTHIGIYNSGLKTSYTFYRFHPLRKSPYANTVCIHKERNLNRIRFLSSYYKLKKYFSPELLDYPPKLSYMILSGSTPRLSSILTTAFDIGPGPHM